jgi:hypothetical protein
VFTLLSIPEFTPLREFKLGYELIERVPVEFDIDLPSLPTAV